MSLGRIQFISLLTKSVTTALGIAQSIIIVRVLTPAEFGLVGLVMSIGGLIGVTQHLGIVDGAIREIAVLRNRDEIGKVFWVSHAVRQVVTIPLSVGLVFLAGLIAVKVYGRPEIIPYIQLFAAALILQGLQDVLGATLTGMKKFGALYSVQILTAAVNVLAFGYLTWTYGVIGFFWAVIVTTALMVALLFMVIASHLRGSLALPRWSDVKQYAGRVMRIGAYMYVARILFVIWQRLPLLVLGGVLAADELGFINVSLTFGSKLTVVAMALSEVNLSWMSSLFAHERDKFAGVVQKNMQRVLVLMMGIALVLLFFAPEILRYVIGAEYLPAHDIILVITTAFFLYSLIDIGTSSVFVPANEPRGRALIYFVMTLISAGVTGWLLLIRPDALLAAYAVSLGALVAYVFMVILVKRRHHILLINAQLALFLLALGLSVGWLSQDPSLALRIIVFLALSLYVYWEARKGKLLPPLPSLFSSGENEGKQPIICFAGAAYDQTSWTNRQHVMSRLAKEHPVLYIEGRIWVIRYLLDNWKRPSRVAAFLRRALWPVRRGQQLYIKAQWNLIPGSRESSIIAWLNHQLNRWHVLSIAELFGFPREQSLVWLYDTEAAEYLSAYPSAQVVYDCVDDHAAQAGVDRNPQRVRAEEEQILKRADLVTVTSERLLQQKGSMAKNVHHVPNAGDVERYLRPTQSDWPFTFPPGRPVIGSVGALDSYKYDFDLLHTAATNHPEWDFVLIGVPLVSRSVTPSATTLQQLEQLANVHMVGAVAREHVPNYVAHFDVCMIPYRNNDYNRASFPLKFWEFMASGKPIVVSGLPELLPYAELVSYVHTPEEFDEAIKKTLVSPDTEQDERRDLAKQHSWEERVRALQRLLLALTHVVSRNVRK